MAFRGIQATNIISNTVGFSDPIFVTNKDGSTPTDVGFLGKIGPTHYAGLVRDAETNSFLLLDSISLSSSTVNDVNALDGTIIKGDLHVSSLTANTIVGNLQGNIINSQGQPVIDNSGALYPTIFQIPKGIVSERPSPAAEGMMWFNTTTKMFEGYDGTDWVQLVPSTFVETP